MTLEHNNVGGAPLCEGKSGQCATSTASDVPSSNIIVSDALQWLENGWAASDNRREAAKIAALVKAQVDLIERLQPYEEQTRHLERRIRELTEQLNCLRLAHETSAPHDALRVQ